MRNYRYLLLVVAMCFSLMGCSSSSSSSSSTSSMSKEEIEEALNLANMNAEWTYSENDDAWTLSIVTAVTNPEIEDEQGVSVCVPGAYIKGVDTDGDGTADVTSGTGTGVLIIDDDASITSTNGQVYKAATAPVIINTGAAGYSEQENQTASATYAAEGYINVACGNRGKSSTVTKNGKTVYTGDAPCCLVDQKNVVRFVKYNILLGQLPGSVDYFVSTGGSGGGAHAAMLAATSNHSDFYPYEAACGAVGVYQDGDTYNTTVTINGEEVALSDGMWGCMAYSAITSLQEADMALAFEYYTNPSYSFNTSFQKQLAAYLADAYKDYINGQNLTVNEADVKLDINGDGDQKDKIKLTISYDAKKHSETNGYYGTYLDLYLARFEKSLESYLERLDYAENWTWFDSNGSALSDSAVAKMSASNKAKAFIAGRYAKGSSSSEQGDPGGGTPPSSERPSGEGPGGDSSGSDTSGSETTQEVGTPDSGTTQSANSTTDSANYSSYSDMLSAYSSDIAEIEAGDDYGNNIVSLYNPLNYIGKDNTENPTWSRILMGASEGDISMYNSLNLQVAWANAGTDTVLEWQWDGGHVPSEILGDSFAYYVDYMYGKHVSGAKKITRSSTKVTTNGTATEATGTDLSSWVSYKQGSVSFSLAKAAAYRTNGAAKAMPAFDVLDYGQEDYVFGSTTADARHWDRYILDILEKQEETLSSLFNAGSDD